MEWIIHFWREWLMGLMGTGLILVIKNVWKQHKDQETYNGALANGVQCILRDMLLEGCREAIRKGFCDTDEKFNLKSMYKAYSELGGNDIITIEYKKTMNLPTEPPIKPRRRASDRLSENHD